MAIYVDDAMIEWRGKRWFHMITDGDLSELHEFAVNKLGLKRAWFQDDGTMPHYDVSAGMRDRAINMFGAIAIDMHGLADQVAAYMAKLVAPTILILLPYTGAGADLAMVWPKGRKPHLRYEAILKTLCGQFLSQPPLAPDESHFTVEGFCTTCVNRARALHADRIKWLNRDGDTVKPGDAGKWVFAGVRARYREMGA